MRFIIGFIKRYAVREAQVAHGRVPAQLQAGGFNNIVAPTVGLVGVNVKADIEERHNGQLQIV